MTGPVHLVRGQNIPWPHDSLSVTVSTGQDVDLSCLLLTAEDRARSDADLVFYNAPAGPGVTLTGGTMAVDLGAVPAEVAQLRLLVSVDPTAPALGHSPVLVRGESPGSAVLFEATFTTERAAHLLEIYRRADAWKIRAVGQGWIQGLRHALELHGIRVDDEPAPVPDVPTLERAAQHLEGIRADLAAAASAYQSTQDYAASRLAADLEEIAVDPALRGSAAHRQTVQRRHDELLATAAARHRKDLEDLQVEISTLEEHLPRELASLRSPAWQRPHSHMDGPPTMIRVGTMALEGQEIGLPVISPLPGRPLLLIGPEPQTHAATQALLRRVTTDVPTGSVHVHHLPGGLPQDLREELSRRADLVSMALESGLNDVLTQFAQPLSVVVTGPAQRLGQDGLTTLQRLISCGPAAGVQLVMTMSEDEMEDLPPDLIQECQIMGSQVCAVLADSPHLTWMFTPDSI